MAVRDKILEYPEACMSAEQPDMKSPDENGNCRCSRNS